jgi:hypothetical protein
MARPTVKIVAINYLSDLAECNPENANLDVHVVLDDGREFTFTVAIWLGEKKKARSP